MSAEEIIKEILYLVQHSTGVVPSYIHMGIAIYFLQEGMHPLDVKDKIICLVHEGTRTYKPNPNLRSCDW